ncbi:UNVERIFIED_CONTAM: hypothetical protein PYX00_006896 [Menopon gallinae]|uniref:Intersectin-1 n=1 Tax=Menopon gallinae TaxID=328185 RepID=A0AAW2HY71_9NEOP
MAVDMGAVDPWVVQPRERARYEDQFRSLNPSNGIITGDQAKEFFLQSQLPPPILGQIWALSDTDADGKMDINEFSIACKLINLKLRGFQIPPTLPPVLRSLTGEPPQPVSQGVTPVGGSVLMGQRAPAPMIPPQPLMPQHTVITPQPVIPSQSVLPPQSAIPPQPVIQSQPVMQINPPLIPSQPIMAATVIPPLVPIDTPTNVSMSSRPSLTGNATISSVTGQVIQTQPVVHAGLIMNQPSVIPGSTPQISGAPSPIPVSTSGMSIDVLPTMPHVTLLTNQIPSVNGVVTSVSSVTGSQPSQPSAAVPAPAVNNSAPASPPVTSTEVTRAPSIESPTSVIASPVIEWAVPHQSKLKYTQLFNTTDRARAGFLSGPQARNIMVETRLRQQILAQIWALADADSDGRLNCEEFVLAMHLCDMAKEGRPIPATLPIELVPPGMRRKRGSSISVSDDKQDNVSAIQNSVTFEDKRKENFDKGQAELERRRAALLEAQRKEQEERERKEREEQERREQLRAEQEARRQQELQKQLERQRELEMEQEEQRRRATEQREAARKELERQRQQEWEKARTQELEAQRMREQDNVLRLKARNQALAIELATLTGKVKELSTKISETRTGVSGVKTTIDGMRATRDTHMSEMAGLKNKLKEQNQRLLLLTQEKAKLEARNKVSAAADAAATEQIRLAFTNKQITIKHLNEKLVDLQNEVKSKTEDVENNNIQLKDLKTRLSDLVKECENIYTNYAEKRDAILQLKAAKGGSSAWGSTVTSWEAGDSWGTPAAADSWGPTNDTTPAPAGQRKYRAIYAFQSRNPDELSFEPGDIILVPIDQNAEPGWLAGELRGATGWFPESYVEPIDQISEGSGMIDVTTTQNKQQLEGILEVPESAGETKTVIEGISELYVAVYPYQASEVGDLSFEQGETITVFKKDGDWWTGTVGNRVGLFPSNYVQKAETKIETSPDQTQAATSETIIAAAAAAGSRICRCRRRFRFSPIE